MMPMINRGITESKQLNRMRDKYLVDAGNKLRDVEREIEELEAEVGPFVDKVRYLDLLYCKLHRLQKRYTKLLTLIQKGEIKR